MGTIEWQGNGHLEGGQTGKINPSEVGIIRNKAKGIYKHIMETVGEGNHRKSLVNKEIGNGNWTLPVQCRLLLI